MNRKDFLKALIAIPAAAVGIEQIKPMELITLGNDKYSVTGSAVEFGVPDSDGDVFAKGCFDAYLPNKRFLDHDSEPIGRATSMSETSNGLEWTWEKI